MKIENRKPNTECNICSLPIYRRPYQLKLDRPVYCSRQCSLIPYTKEPKKCLGCDNTFLRRLNKKYCSVKCANSNRIKRGTYSSASSYKGSNKTLKLKSLILETRPPKCNRCDYDKIKYIQVHHKIERCNGGSDDLDNLELLCANCHIEHHYDEKLQKNKNSIRI